MLQEISNFDSNQESIDFQALRSCNQIGYFTCSWCGSEKGLAPLYRHGYIVSHLGDSMVQPSRLTFALFRAGAAGAVEPASDALRGRRKGMATSWPYSTDRMPRTLMGRTATAAGGLRHCWRELPRVRNR